MSREGRSLAGDDRGLSLLETMIALAIAMVMFAALAAASIAGLKGVVFSRQNQQAADVLNAAVEEVRGMRYANVTMTDSDLTDPRITGTPKMFTVPNGIGAEQIYSRPTGALAPHLSQESPDGKVQFSLARYVTLPPGAVIENGLPSMVRFTAMASWRSYGRTHLKAVSTILTGTLRGLPLPRYMLSAVGPASATRNPGPGVFVDFGMSVRNLGARDAFNISASTGTWRYYLDNGAGTNAGNGVRDADENTELGNFDAATGNLAPDTGQIEPNATPVKFVAQREIGSGESGTSTVVFTTVSAAQPLVPAGTKSLGFVLTVQAGAVVVPPSSGTCPAPPAGASATAGTTLTSFFLHNRPAGNTVTQMFNNLARADCTMQASDFDFSTDDPGRSKGRVLWPGGTAGNVAKEIAAEWRYQVVANTLVQGTAVLRFQFRCTSASGPTSSGSVTFQAMLGHRQNNNSTLNGFTSVSSATTAALVCPASGWSTVTIPVSVAGGMSVNSGKWLALRLVTFTGSSRVLLNYDSPTSASTIVLPVAP